nr:hypothetical protein [Raoultibacter phocaeensis]
MSIESYPQQRANDKHARHLHGHSDYQQSQPDGAREKRRQKVFRYQRKHSHQHKRHRSDHTRRQFRLRRLNLQRTAQLQIALNRFPCRRKNSVHASAGVMLHLQGDGYESKLRNTRLAFECGKGLVCGAPRFELASAAGEQLAKGAFHLGGYVLKRLQKRQPSEKARFHRAKHIGHPFPQTLHTGFFRALERKPARDACARRKRKSEDG